MLSSTVGVASLLSFPVLVALGLPPVVANVTNTLGLIPGGLGGSSATATEVREAGPIARTIVLVCALGAVVGAALLLGLPPGVFEAIVPYLILFTCLLVGVQPRIASVAAGPPRARHGVALAERRHMSPATTAFATITGVYGGYFGAGAGVMMVAVLGIGTDLELRIVNGLKTLSLMVGNVVAGLIFIVVADRAGTSWCCSRPARWWVATSAPASAASSRTRSSGGRSSPPVSSPPLLLF